MYKITGTCHPAARDREFTTYDEARKVAAVFHLPARLIVNLSTGTPIVPARRLSTA